MSNCYICGDKLSEGKVSDEHVLPNCIGGRLRLKNALCVGCNSKFGSDIDSHLCEEMKEISNLLNIKRQRNKPSNIQAMGSDGDQYTVKPGFKFHKSIPVKETVNGFDIRAKDYPQFIKILKDIKKKYPHIDEDEILQNAQEQNYFVDELKINFTFDDDQKTLKAICKIAVNYYLYKKYDMEYIQHLIPYLTSDRNIECVQVYYPDENDIYDLSEGHEILHSIILHGNCQEKILYAYIELFSTFKFIVLLNDDYDGEEISNAYFYNVITTKNICKPLKKPKTRKELMDIFDEPINTSNFIAAIKNLLHLIYIKHLKDACTEMVSGIVDEWYKENLGKVIDDELLGDLMTDFEKELKILAPHLHKNFDKSTIDLIMRLFGTAIEVALKHVTTTSTNDHSSTS